MPELQILSVTVEVLRVGAMIVGVMTVGVMTVGVLSVRVMTLSRFVYTGGYAIPLFTLVGTQCFCLHW